VAAACKFLERRALNEEALIGATLCYSNIATLAGKKRAVMPEWGMSVISSLLLVPERDQPPPLA